MLFNSIEFLIFLPVVWLLYFVTPMRKKWILLLLASYVFYMTWNVAYALLLITSTSVAYVSALAIQHRATFRKSTLPLVLGIVINVGILLYFKYTEFFLHSIEKLSQIMGAAWNAPTFSIVLPIGISFYTFHTVGYIIDVYRGKQKAETHLGYFALFVSFFPLLIAGPIERAGNLLPQLRSLSLPSDNDFRTGMRLFLWGFFKKVVIADRASIVVANVYAKNGFHHPLAIIVGTMLFAFQIYCDFSGYTDIARGVGYFFGVKLSVNFKAPLMAISVQDFWRRWHITLTQWFRDYIYFPLGGNRRSFLRNSLNILIVFFISGLWHGANWTFVIWGLLHGSFIILGNITDKARIAIRSSMPVFLQTPLVWLRVGTTFCLTSLLWILFRSDSISTAWNMFTGIFKPFVWDISFLRVGQIPPAFALLIFGVTILFMLVIEWLDEVHALGEKIDTGPPPFRLFVYPCLTVAILIFGVFTSQNFIYFRF